MLRAEGTDGRDMEGVRGMKGYYRRPSRAIEKGGGFFVPGLEGERIRVISAAALILMIATNRAGVLIAPPALIISELIAIISAVILFVQGLAAAFPSGRSSPTLHPPLLIGLPTVHHLLNSFHCPTPPHNIHLLRLYLTIYGDHQSDLA